jgi:cytochrome P450
MSLENLESNASILVIGGSETSATLLAGVTYLLLMNPETLAKLTNEVRTRFKTEREINIYAVGQLTYMLACLNEALRMYPPVAVGLPRVVPPGGKTISGRFVPKNVSRS